MLSLVSGEKPRISASELELLKEPDALIAMYASSHDVELLIGMSGKIEWRVNPVFHTLWQCALSFLP